MDYRVRYRDIPWPVAIGVLPGKIIGSCIIEPSMNFKRHWKRILTRWLKFWCITVVALAVLLMCIALLDDILDGEFIGWLKHLWGRFNE